MKEIEMIASFNNKSVPHPHRLRLETEDESLLVIYINKVLFAEENKRENNVKYRCNYIMNDVKYTVDIYFDKLNLKWFIQL